MTATRSAPDAPLDREVGATECPACGHDSWRAQDSSRDYLTRRRYGLAACAHCGLSRTQIDDEDPEADAYGEAYYRSEKGKFLPLVEQVFEASHRRRARALLSRFAPSSVLEVGCGRAEMLRLLAAKGVRTAGLESPDAPAWILGNDVVDVRAFDPRAPHPFGDEHFDLILIWHVLEHLEDPARVLADVAWRLNPGGHVVVSVPRRDSLQAGLRLSTWFHLDVPRHRWHFRRSDLERTLARAGLEIVAFEGGDLLQDLYGAWQSLANRISLGRHNALYWALHGGPFHRRFADTAALLWQVLTAPLWISAGTLLFVAEMLLDRRGTMTVVARAPQSSTEPKT